MTIFAHMQSLRSSSLNVPVQQAVLVGCPGVRNGSAFAGRSLALAACIWKRGFLSNSTRNLQLRTLGLPPPGVVCTSGNVFNIAVRLGPFPFACRNAAPRMVRRFTTYIIMPRILWRKEEL